MSRTVACFCTSAALLVMLTALAQPADAQILPKPDLGTPTIIVAPASLAAWSTSKAKVNLSWPAVAGAAKYRLTRIENNGAPEITIEELPSTSFVFEGATCAAGTSQPTCIYEDVSKLRRPKTPWPYPHAVESGKLYTYRVWAIFPGPIVSPPSAPATVQVK